MEETQKSSLSGYTTLVKAKKSELDHPLLLLNESFKKDLLTMSKPIALTDIPIRPVMQLATIMPDITTVLSAARKRKEAK